VVITRSGFGSPQGEGSAIFSGVAADIVSWSDTSVTAVVPSGASAGYAGIVQNGVVSNGKYFVPHGLPGIDSVSSDYALVGDTITVTGSDFGSMPGMLTVGGVAVTPSNWSDTEVVFDVPENVESGYVGVTRDGMTSNGRWLTVAPLVTGLSSWWAAPGSDVTISGQGFGDVQGDNWACLNGASLPVVSWSDTEIVVTVPQDAATGLVGVVRAPWATSNGRELVVTTPATIDSLDRSYVLPGEQVTISGSDFGELVATSEVRIGDLVCDVLSWTDTEIVVTAPADVVDGYVGVYKWGLSSNGKWLRVGAPVPQVEGISNWWALPGETVTITGWGFGPEQGEGYPVFAGVAADVVSWSDTAVTAVVPTGADTGYAGIVQSGITSNGVYFMPYHPPEITSLSHGTAAVGDRVTVYGLGFRDAPGTLTLSDVQLTAVSWSDTEIVFDVPEGAVTGYVGVTHDGKTSNGAYLAIAP
jgi:hypothetical protein